jgi:4-hydroxybenzoate polyprenyltransferase
MKSITAILDDIKVAHTIFALPFAVMSAFIAAAGFPGWRIIGLIVVAMVFVRSAAMAFNRLVDFQIDIHNPRTKKRALPAGRATRIEYMIFIVGSSVGFVATCGFINLLALKLSPLAIGIVFFYSYTKRFTAYSHFFLGLALALAPMGAWVAVKEEISLVALILGMAVVFWLAGLDTIYSTQDVAFDKSAGLNSIPQKFGVPQALKMAATFHAIMVTLLIAVGIIGGLSWAYGCGVLFTAGLLWYEHSLVRPEDLTKVNVAFFNVNGLISVGLMLFAIVDTLLFTPGVGS